MIGLIVGAVVKLVPGLAGQVFKHLETRASSEVERQRIQATRDQHAMSTAATVVTAGMQHRAFWIVWLMFAGPLGLWWVAVMADTIANGALPDVATIPPQLVPWADVIFQNIFYSGAAVAGAAVLGNSIRRR